MPRQNKQDARGVSTVDSRAHHGHPHVRRRDADYNPTKPCRHFIQSPAFAGCFGRISEVVVFEAVAGYCGSQGGGPLGPFS